ncbi:hypothetical protein LQ757_04520 [Agromyces sp. SYSU K20354]|uniref:hypothetical protein n=1 Tax=Agromyces cavernae TaxID=2898659 RepID=UPI001E417EBA|nr:hypothetical protein [Agromyces cavernae]MCD2441538.1 hypothetical protein [Agromyces cavernae]
MGRRMPGRLLLVTPAVVAAAVLAGCATAAPSPGAAPSPSAPSSSDADATLLCGDSPVSVDALEQARPATELPPDVVAVLEGPSVPIEGPLSAWLIETESAEHVAIMRKVDPPQDLGGGDIRDYQLVAISTGTEHAMPLTPPWGLEAAGDCALTISLGDLIQADVVLDPDARPEPDDDAVALLVTERACNSGEPATGRVELVELVETETTVEVVIGVRPNRPDDGGPAVFTCPGNPPTPFTVDLEQPLGDRAILNAAVVPAREITAPTGW